MGIACHRADRASNFTSRGFFPRSSSFKRDENPSRAKFPRYWRRKLTSALIERSSAANPPIARNALGRTSSHDGAVKAGINESPKEPSPWDVTADQRPVVACIDVMAVPMGPAIPNQYIVHFPEPWRFGVSVLVTGNALLCKKCFALRTAFNIGHDEGWMVESIYRLGQ